MDRKQLPKPETATRLRAFSEDVTATTAAEVQKTSRLAPQSHTEQAILKIWCDLLDLAPEDLSALDSFFEVGGHSLLVVQVQRQMRTALARDIAITDIFRFPTVRALAAHLGEAGEEDRPDAASRGAARAAARLARMGRR